MMHFVEHPRAEVARKHRPSWPKNTGFSNS
jgi:hypothetical protein